MVGIKKNLIFWGEIMSFISTKQLPPDASRISTRTAVFAKAQHWRLSRMQYLVCPCPHTECQRCVPGKKRSGFCLCQECWCCCFGIRRRCCVSKCNDREPPQACIAPILAHLSRDFVGTQFGSENFPVNGCWAEIGSNSNVLPSPKRAWRVRIVLLLLGQMCL